MNSLSHSKRKYYSLEVTTVLGCSVNCLYCPQSALSSASRGIKERVLTYENFKKYLSNVPHYVDIHWTGYSEPCLARDLDRMIKHTHEKGHKQLISTTLDGVLSSAKYVSEFAFFKSFTLHLPDKHGLMRGIENKKGYIERVLDLFPEIYKKNIQGLNLLTFGSEFHPKLEELIKEYKKKGIDLKVDRRDHLHQRAGQVDKVKIENLEKIISNNSVQLQENNLNDDNQFKFRTNASDDLDIKKDFQINQNSENLQNWFCSYKRLSQPVLLPDGRTNICCQDYQLSCITGNLVDQNYEEIVKYDDFKQKFFSGKLNPCINCEYYKQL